MSPDPGAKYVAQFEVYPWLLAAGVLASRVLTTGPLYFIDGPGHVAAAKNGTYLIQPPGYWLFNRTIALFPDPERGIVFLNWTFSVFGVVAFYYAARLLVKEHLARWGAATYAALFYVWFVGDIHSTYASQVLFPVLMFLFFLLHRQQPRFAFLAGASVAFAFGAGFRPTDGLFLGFMFMYYVLRHAPLRQALLCIAMAGVFCLGWLVPTLMAFAKLRGLNSQFTYSTNLSGQVSPLFHGITHQSMASVARFVVPLVVAFWPLLPAVLRTLPKLRQDDMVRLLWLWVTPGAAFFVLFYMSHAPYVTFLTAGVLLLALKQLDCSRPALRTLLLATCLFSNVMFFLLFIPISSKSLAVNVLNVYAGKYTRYAVAHRWQPDLSELVDRNTLKPIR